MAQTQGNRLTIELVESRVRGNPHARFGRRPGETERPKRRHRAPSRPHLGLQAMEETRRRVQQQLLGHRGRKQDPLYRIRNTLRAGTDKLTGRQIERIEAGLQAGDPHFEVTVAWRCYQQLRSAFAATNLADGRTIAVQVLESFPSCPIPEIARLGRTLNAWRMQFLAYFTTQRASNGGTEAINGIIELHRPSPAASATPPITSSE